MSGRIVVLPNDLTNKIAAGEVIERPASIVKELLENAIDAGATDIVIELERGGCESVRVTDNGEGIEPEDAALAFSRFATSKIYQFDDIYKVHSFGFRGEALPSIASISRVEMVTKKRGALAGVRIVAEAGEVKEIVAAGCPVGTSVSVTNIFGPVPVRRKFLKSEPTEQGHCLDVVSRLALSHPTLSLKVSAKGRDILNIPSTKEPGERLALVLGSDFLDQMVSLSGVKNEISIQGFASQPSLTRANSKHIYPFVNKRFIRDHLINHAVMTAYRNMIEAKRYPVLVLFLDLPPHDVDVNVHPAKMEVRFRDPRLVYEAIVELLAGALGRSYSRGSSPTAHSSIQAQKTTTSYSNHYPVQEAPKHYYLNSSGNNTDIAANWTRRITYPAPNRQINWEGVMEEERQEVVLSDLVYIGQVMDTYLILASQDKIFLLDQHAAHERLIFENLKKRSARSKGYTSSQRLLIPEVMSLSPSDYAFLMGSLQLLLDCGFEIEPFGNDTVVIKSLPSLFANLEPKRLINDFLAEFIEREDAAFDEKKGKIFAFLACKGAVKANHKLSQPEVASLCKDLDAIPNISSCPHGRPVFISYTAAELEKMFKRS